jgi:putative FmdB family regulatory protein
MPTYDYVCQNCDHAFEEFQSITASPLRKCPKCGKLKLKRLIGTGSAIIFKGSGFYQTDYRSDNYTQGAKSAKSGDSAAAKPSETESKDAKSETKTETKTETKAESKTETKTETAPKPKSESKKKTA